MNRSARRRWLRERAAERRDAGLPPKAPPIRSHYQTADIRESVQADLAKMHAQIKAQRDRMRDPNWAFRSQQVRIPLNLSARSGRT